MREAGDEGEFEQGEQVKRVGFQSMGSKMFLIPEENRFNRL